MLKKDNKFNLNTTYVKTNTPISTMSSKPYSSVPPENIKYPPVSPSFTTVQSIVTHL